MLSCIPRVSFGGTGLRRNLPAHSLLLSLRTLWACHVLCAAQFAICVCTQVDGYVFTFDIPVCRILNGDISETIV